MQFIAGLIIGAAAVVLAPYSIICHALSGYWPWQLPFCICEDCWWSGRARIHEYAPCPRCHKWFMRIAGFNLTADVIDAFILETGKDRPPVIAVPDKDVYSYPTRS